MSARRRRRLIGLTLGGLAALFIGGPIALLAFLAIAFFAELATLSTRPPSTHT
jgi:hypothetical protein